MPIGGHSHVIYMGNINIVEKAYQMVMWYGYVYPMLHAIAYGITYGLL